MAGRLLFGILLCSFQEIHVEAIPPPKLTANTQEIMETETVTLNCLPELNQSPSRCYFYTEGKETKTFSCMVKLTGTKLLQMAHLTSPAEVKVKCYYTFKYKEEDGDFLSSPSDTFTITIFSNIGIVGRPHAVTPIKVLTVTAGDTEEHLITSSLTTVTSASETVADNLSTSIGVSAAATTKSPVDRTSGDGDDVTASNTDMRLWKLVAVTAGFGVTVGVISLGLALLCTKGRDGAISCSSVLHAAREKRNRRDPQYETFVVYHEYATISDEPYASVHPNEMVYSTVQPV